MRRPSFPVLLFWLAAVFLLGFALSRTDISGVSRALSLLSLPQFGILLFANLFILGLITLRWDLGLRAFGYKVSFFRMVAYRLSGFALSYFTPGPQLGGEPLQILLLRRREEVPGDAAIASVFLDKLMEMLANFAFLAFGLAVLSRGGAHGGLAMRWGWLPAAFLVALPLVYLAVLRSGFRPLSRISKIIANIFNKPWAVKISRYMTRAEARIGEFLRTRPAAFSRLVFVSLAVWAASLLEFYLLLRFLGLYADLKQTVVILTAARLAFLLPFPGALGALEAGLVLAVGWAGFDPAYGLAAGLIIRARDVTLGGIGLFLGGRAVRKPLS